MDCSKFSFQQKVETGRVTDRFPPNYPPWVFNFPWTIRKSPAGQPKGPSSLPTGGGKTWADGDGEGKLTIANPGRHRRGKHKKKKTFLGRGAKSRKQNKNKRGNQILEITAEDQSREALSRDHTE